MLFALAVAGGRAGRCFVEAHWLPDRIRKAVSEGRFGAKHSQRRRRNRRTAGAKPAQNTHGTESRHTGPGGEKFKSHSALGAI